MRSTGRVHPSRCADSGAGESRGNRHAGRTPSSLALAPVTITPTKPLTPTHIKGLLWLDVLGKSCREIADTTCIWNPRMSNLSAQTLTFWAYLDDVVGPVDWSRYTETQLGELYVESHRAGRGRPNADRLRGYLDRVEVDGWVHPASRRLVDLWREQLDLVNVADPGLAGVRPLGLPAEAALERLAARDLIIDHRRYGGPAYLDGTAYGLPLRQLIGEDGLSNYLLPVLRDLIPVIGRRDRIVLVHDPELGQDYLLLDRVLTTLGARVSRLALRRVALDGVVRSSRFGGWQGRTLADLAAACLEHVDLATYRLGMRLYFIAVLERDAPQSFRPDLLRRSLRRARRLLDTYGAAAGDGAADGTDEETDAGFRDFLAGLVGAGGYVDPYRLTTSLFDRHRPALAGRLIRTVLG